MTEVQCFAIRRIEFEDAKEEWTRMYNANLNLSPYSSYEFAACYRKFFHLGLKRFFMRQKFFMVTFDSFPLAIVPLIFSTGNYYLYGDMCASGYLDIISGRQLSDEELDIVFKLVKGKIGSAKLHLNKINDKSGILQYLKKKYKESTPQPCVNVPFGDNYDEYIANLSKSVRQNIRTAYNRMNRENKRWEFKVLCNMQIPQDIVKQQMLLYETRSEHRNGKKNNSFTAFIRDHFNPITISTAEMSDNLCAMFYIEGRLAAFLAGYITNDKSAVVIPRLAINDEFSLYCPGTLLVTELIKYCIANSSIRNVDLSRGDEKYKYALGGQTHYNHSFVI